MYLPQCLWSTFTPTTGVQMHHGMSEVYIHLTFEEGFPPLFRMISDLQLECESAK